MTGQINPYSPPQHRERPLSWWVQLKNIFFPKDKPSADYRKIDFSKGDAIKINGIAFFINPEIPQILFAGSPSSDQSESRFQLIVEQAIDQLPTLLSMQRELGVDLSIRKLEIQIVSDYTGIHSKCIRATDAGPVAAFSQR